MNDDLGRILYEGNCPIPGYRLISLLGSGGYGEVWKAEGPKATIVAIKYVPKYAGGQKIKAERKGIERIREIQHEYLLPIIDVHDTLEGLFVVCDLAEMSLQNYFGLLRRVRNENVVYIGDESVYTVIGRCHELLLQAAKALDTLHANGLQHLDIKPANLLFSRGSCRIGDFGTVAKMDSECPDKAAVMLCARSTVESEGITTTPYRSLHEVPSEQAFRRDVTLLTITGGFTPYYAPPEAFDGQFTRYFDQYSLTLVFCELVFGRIPFGGPIEKQLAQRRHGQLELDYLPEDIRPVIARALAPNPIQRFASCEAVMDALGVCPTVKMAYECLIYLRNATWSPQDIISREA